MVLIMEFGCSVLVHLGWDAPYSNELHKAIVDAAVFDLKQR